MDEVWLKSFQEQLDRHYAWPSLYTFKFIVSKGKEDEVRELFPMHQPSERNSKNGNYISFTVQMMMPSSEAVLNVYRAASGIEGLIAL
jgi:uncharacterized protein